MQGTHPGATSCPSIYYQVTAEDQHHLLLLRPFSPPHLATSICIHRYAYVLFIHSARISLGRWEASAATHFEDARHCTATCRAKVSFACGGVGSAPLTGGGGRTCMAGSLINKIYYGNVVDETRRRDLSRGHNRRKRSCNHTRAYSHSHGGTST